MDNNNNPVLENIDIKHVRRVRYSGTHPKKFSEKYKELQPEKYATDVAKIIQNGKTPAGMHISIFVKEILDFLQIKPGQIGLDATLGYGGHTRKMLECLEGRGHLYAIDVDHIELEKTKKRLESLGYGPNILTNKQLNFANIDKVIEKDKKFDFVLADLGLSSMQIDNPERGFTFKYDGPLDLRLNPEEGITATERLKELSEEEIEEMLVANSDEPYARQIAHEIIKQIENGLPITTTKQLSQIIADALMPIPFDDRKYETKKSCQRTFQAIRIDINKEYEVLKEFLDKLPQVLNKGGRVAILSFHSGEDRLVKKSFKYFHNEGLYSEIAKDVIRPSAEECYANPRAHSAKMRWAIKS
ncbi:MAG: 16S rRNA (cytosine(1402)-N(4))-methyltransferase RsmH [Clostridia bacterium]|jgi:16S rRNA (cytosine1402-N4)-methyltransferase|nr:16S rRNA (cytosine(1402)-N(4))-methyltransferase RsmH [Clostridia bacterium]